MPLYGGLVRYPAPLSPAVAILRLTGPWPEPVVSPTLTRLPSQPRLTLRVRTESDVTVRVEHFAWGRWVLLATQTGSEFSFLVKPQRDPFRVWIEGDSPGWLELIETRG